MSAIDRDLQINIIKGMLRDLGKSTSLDFDEMDDDELDQLQENLNQQLSEQDEHEPVRYSTASPKNVSAFAVLKQMK